MSESRLLEIKSLLTDNPETVEFLCSLPEDRYKIVFEIMKLAKFLEQQKVNNCDIKLANDVLMAYSLRGNEKIALMAFIYGKIQGKREERLRYNRR